MINSVLASSHHFYIVFIDVPRIKTLANLLSLFEEEKHVKKISVNLKGVNADVVHMQTQIPGAYGSENLLSSNKGEKKKGQQFYWYDFYIGKTEIKNKSYFYICYPYSKMGKYLEQLFMKKGLKKNILKPILPSVLEYLKNRNEDNVSKVEREGFITEITKYSAEVKEEKNPTKINIIGFNPLKSRVYNILKRDTFIEVEPISLKLICNKSEVGSFDLSFDRIGNYRFWLRKYQQEVVIPLMPLVLRFFFEIKSLEESSFISSYSLLEDEQ